MRDFGFLVAALLMAAGHASAQIAQPPPRPGAPAGATATQELSLTSSGLGGYDDNIVTQGAGQTIVARRSGRAFLGDIGANYRAGTMRRFVQVHGRESISNYPGSGVGRRLATDLSTIATSPVGRRTSITAWHTFHLAPFFSLGIMPSQPPLGGGGELGPDTNPANSLAPGRSVTNNVNVSANHQLTRRTSLDAWYNLAHRHYTDRTSFNTSTHSVSAGISRALGRSLSLRAAYYGSKDEFALPDLTLRPQDTRGADVALTYERMRTPTRGVLISLRGGARNVNTVDPNSRAPVRYTIPSVSGFVNAALGRSWSVAGDYTRSLRVLQGASPESYLSNSVTLTAGGRAGPVLTALWVTYLEGQTVRIATATSPSAFEGLSGHGQITVPLTGGLSALVGFSRYDHRLNPQASLALGVAQRVKRDAIRVGMSWTMPVWRSGRIPREGRPLPREGRPQI